MKKEENKVDISKKEKAMNRVIPVSDEPEEKKRNSNCQQKDKFVINDRYKECDVSYREDDHLNEFINDEEKLDNIQMSELKSEPTNITMNIKFTGKGYANIHKKKNDDGGAEIIENKILEEKSEIECLDGKIKIINKENLKKLLLD